MAKLDDLSCTDRCKLKLAIKILEMYPQCLYQSIEEQDDSWKLSRSYDGLIVDPKVDSTHDETEYAFSCVISSKRTIFLTVTKLTGEYKKKSLIYINYFVSIHSYSKLFGFEQFYEFFKTLDVKAEEIVLNE